MDRKHWELLKARTEDARTRRDVLREKLHALPEYKEMMEAWADFIEASRADMRGYHKLPVRVQVRIEREREAEKVNRSADIRDASDLIDAGIKAGIEAGHGS